MHHENCTLPNITAVLDKIDAAKRAEFETSEIDSVVVKEVICVVVRINKTVLIVFLLFFK